MTAGKLGSIAKANQESKQEIYERMKSQSQGQACLEKQKGEFGIFNFSRLLARSIRLATTSRKCVGSAKYDVRLSTERSCAP